MEQKQSVVIRARICRQCGTTFLGGPRAWYCPSCREERKKEQALRYQRNRRAGKSIVVGETLAKCEKCGAVFTMMAARQKYCIDCRHEAWKSSDQRQGLVYYTENREEINSVRSQQRKGKWAGTTCIVCGALLPDVIGGRNTCSERCKKIRDGYLMARADFKRGRRKRLPTWEEWVEKHC
jgi:hypothetical protein